MAARRALLLGLLAAAGLAPLLVRGCGAGRGPRPALPPARAEAAERPPAELEPAHSAGSAAREASAAPLDERPAPDGPAAAPARAEEEAADAEAFGPVPPAAEAGALHAIGGRLRSRRGAFADRDRLLAGHVRFELYPEGEPARARVARLLRLDDPSGEELIGFAFEPVPDGAYVLATSSTDALRIAPPRLALRPPVGPLEFWCQDDVQTLALGFRVLDAETLEPLADYTAWSIRTEVDPEAGVLFHAGPLELAEVPLVASFRWRLWAEGYAPAAGDERDFTLAEEGRFLALVHLRRGFGRRFVLLGRDPAMRPLRGARLELDGTPAGETDAEGALEVFLPAAPRAFKATWGALQASGSVPADAAAAGRAMTTVLVLARPGERD